MTGGFEVLGTGVGAEVRCWLDERLMGCAAVAVVLHVLVVVLA